MTIDEVESRIWAAIAESADGAALRGKVFGKDGLLAKYLRFLPAQPARVKEICEQIYKRLADLDKEVELRRGDWKRVREGIEQENTVINHRVGWLFSSQVFLFGAFAAVFVAALKDNLLENSLPAQVVLFAISVVGVAVCLFVIVSVDAAHKQMRFLERWWFTHYHPAALQDRDELFDAKKLKDHPPINGMFDEYLYFVLSSQWLPVPVVAGWLLLLGAVFFDKVWHLHQAEALTFVATCVAFGIGVGVFKLLRTKRRPPPQPAKGSAGS